MTKKHICIDGNIHPAADSFARIEMESKLKKKRPSFSFYFLLSSRNNNTKKP